jgi:hypothetical protein
LLSTFIFLLVNPWSLPTMLVVVVLIGVAVGRFSPGLSDRSSSGLATLASVTFALILGLIGVTFVACTTFADAEALSAARAAQAGDWSGSARAWANATKLAPYEPVYARGRAEALANVGLESREPSALKAALDQERSVVERFAPLPSDYLLMARIRLALGDSAVTDMLDLATDSAPSSEWVRAARLEIEAQIPKSGP